MLARIMSWFGVYWYQFEEGKKWGMHLGEARSKLLNPHSSLIETNDRSIV